MKLGSKKVHLQCERESFHRRGGAKSRGSGGFGAAPVMKTSVEQNRFGQTPGLWVLLGLGWMEAAQQQVSDVLARSWIGLADRVR